MSGSSDYTQTPVLGLYKPTYDADDEMWGTHLNANADTLDHAFSPISGVFLPLAGGTMGGAITLAGDPVAPLQPVTLQYLNANAAQGGPFLPLSGGTMSGPLNVTATGGNTSRSVQDHFGEVYNVKDYGAKMDGATDDYASLNSLVNAVGASPGAVIYFPPSPHPMMLSRRIDLVSNQTWWAYPGSVTIMPTIGNTDTVLLLSCSSGGNVRFYGLTFDGGGQDFANGNPVTQAYRMNGVVLDHCTFQNTRGIAFNGSGVNDLVVRGCTFTNCGNHYKTTNNWNDAQQTISNSSGDGVTWGFRTRVSDCTFYECGGDMINLGGIIGVQIENNTFTTVSKPYLSQSFPAYFSAIFPLFCTDVVIVGNRLTGISGNAIDAPSTWEMTVSGNTIVNTGQAAIGMFDGAGYSGYGAPRGAQNIVIVGNVILNSGQWTASTFRSGININGGTTSVASNIRITNNVITDIQTTKTQLYGINATGTFTGVWVDPSNQLSGNATAPLNGAALSGFAATDAGALSTNYNTTLGGTLAVTGITTLSGGTMPARFAEASWEFGNGAIGIDTLLVQNNGGGGLVLADGVYDAGWRFAVDTGGTGNLSINRVVGTGSLSINPPIVNFSGGTVNMANATSNVLNFGTAGFAAPTFGTRSGGTKVVIYAAVGAGAADYAIGMEGGYLWHSVQDATSAIGFKWYGGTTLAMQLTNTGALSVTNSVGVGGTTGPTWTTGSAAPASTQPVGSLYSRVGGAVGATLYVSRGAGAWAAVAGV